MKRNKQGMRHTTLCRDIQGTKNPTSIDYSVLTTEERDRLVEENCDMLAECLNELRSYAIGTTPKRFWSTHSDERFRMLVLTKVLESYLANKETKGEPSHVRF